jgi:hypothetical protein
VLASQSSQRRAEQEQKILSLVRGLDAEAKMRLIERIIQEKGDEGIPLAIFKSALPGLEAITCYLRDHKQMRINEIADSLGRKRSTIYATLRNANFRRKTTKTEPDCSQSTCSVPLHIFANRAYSILESLTHHLRDQEHMGFAEIAQYTGKKQSTLRTVYWRYHQKEDK